MIKNIRSYFRDQILLVDSELQENPSAFYDADIGESLLDRSYQITIDGMTVVVRDSHFERQITVGLTIFGFGYRDQVANYDDLLEKAICIEDNILNLQNFVMVETITNIVSSGIEASKLPSNDDAFQININFTLTQAYFREP
jgi:hypothetical protein